MAAHLEGSMSGPWIERIGPDEADGTLAEAYERISRGRALDHILEIHTLHPQSLIDHYALYRAQLVPSDRSGSLKRPSASVPMRGKRPANQRSGR